MFIMGGGGCFVMRKNWWRKQWVVLFGVVLAAAVVLGSTLAMGRAAVVSGVTPQEEETVCLPAITRRYSSKA